MMLGNTPTPTPAPTPAPAPAPAPALTPALSPALNNPFGNTNSNATFGITTTNTFRGFLAQSGRGGTSSRHISNASNRNNAKVNSQNNSSNSGEKDKKTKNTEQKENCENTKKNSKIVLSYKGLERVETLKIKDFKINFGNNEFYCNRFAASFLSSKIQKHLINDPTLESLDLDDLQTIVTDNKLTLSDFNQLLSQLFRGEEILITELNRKALFDLSNVLGNEELGLKVIHSSNDLNEENVISRLNYLHSFNYQCDKEITFVSENYDNFSTDELKKLDVSVLKLILSNDSLVVSDEDSLYSQICEFGEGYEELLECIEFEYLSPTKISEFLNNYEFESLTYKIWQSLCRRLELPVVTENNNHRFYTDIFEYLNKQNISGFGFSGKNIAISSNDPANNILSITNPRNMTEVSLNFPNLTNVTAKWIQFNFMSKSVIIRKIKLFHKSTLGVQLSLSGSNDGTNFISIDVLKNPIKRDDWYEYYIKKCTTKYRFIRLNIEPNDKLDCIGENAQTGHGVYFITCCKFLGHIE